MTSHDAELSRNMDRITQLQDSIDNLVTIMYSTISFLTRKADFKQVNPDIPITQTIPRPEGSKPPRETISENCTELVQDFLKKAKQIEYLISILPPHNAHTDTIATQPENHVNNRNDRKDTKNPLVASAQRPPPSPTQLERESLPKPPEQASDEPVSDHQPNDPTDEDDDSAEFDRLQAEIHAAQHRYEEALMDAGP